MATCRGDRGVSALTMAHALNRDVADAYGREPLPDSEVAGIARSVERYRRKWERQGHKTCAASGACSDANRYRKDSAADGSNAPVGRRGYKPSTWYREGLANHVAVANTDNGHKPLPLAGLMPGAPISLASGVGA